jgi:hypothetical protein
MVVVLQDRKKNTLVSYFANQFHVKIPLDPAYKCDILKFFLEF